MIGRKLDHAVDRLNNVIPLRRKAILLAYTLRRRAESILNRLASDRLRLEVAKNIGISSSAKIGSIFAGLLMQVVLARTLGVAEFGIYTFVWAILLTLLTIGQFGLDLASIRFVSQYRVAQEWHLVHGFIRSSRALAISGSIVLGLVAGSVVVRLYETKTIEDSLAWALLGGLPVLPLYALVAVQSGILRGLDRLSQALVIQNVLFPLGVSALLVPTAFIVDTPNATVALVASAIALGSVACLQHYYIAKTTAHEFGNGKVRYEAKIWLHTSISMMFGAGLQQLMAQIDILLLGFFAGTTYSGIYAVAARFAKMINMGQQLSNQSTAHMLPGLYSRRLQAELQRVVSLTALVSAITTIPILVAFFVFPTQILSIFGEGFSEQGTVVLQILILGQFVNAISGPNGLVMYMTGHQNEMLWILLATLLVNAGAVFMLLEPLGIVGVAYAASLAIVFRNVVTSLLAKRQVGVNTTVFASIGWRGL